MAGADRRAPLASRTAELDRVARSASAAAERVGMARVSLLRWLDRRRHLGRTFEGHG
jgi:hypothetical protein